MLRRFSVRNYRNFADEVTLDLTKTRHYTFNPECVKDGLVSKAVLQGRNGCGKTNLGMALFDIVHTLTDLAADAIQKDGRNFLNGYSDSEYAEFAYEFQSPMGIIEYRYRKTDPDTIVYESLILDGKHIFERSEKCILRENNNLSEYGAGTLRMDICPGNLSALRYIVNNTVQDGDSPLGYVMDFASHMLYFRSTQEGNVYAGLLDKRESISDFLADNNMVEEFRKFLTETAGLDMELDIIRPAEGMEPVLVQKTPARCLVFGDVASGGTNALLRFFYWMKHFGGIRFLYIDEFDAYYHYELSEKVLNILKGYDMQMVLTTHNTSLLNSRLLRPDCCLRLEGGVLKSFSDSTDMEIRQGHNLEKLYRGGEFDSEQKVLFIAEGRTDGDSTLTGEDRMQLENSLRTHKELYLRLGQ